MRTGVIIDEETSISIHEPLAGLDYPASDTFISASAISIHEPLAGLDVVTLIPFAILLISIHEPLAGLDGFLLFSSGR